MKSSDLGRARQIFGEWLDAKRVLSAVEQGKVFASIAGAGDYGDPLQVPVPEKHRSALLSGLIELSRAKVAEIEAQAAEIGLTLVEPEPKSNADGFSLTVKRNPQQFLHN